MWKQQKRLTNRVGYNVVKEDYSKTLLTEEDRIRLALSSSTSYNKRLLEDRQKTGILLHEVNRLSNPRLFSSELARSTL
jgi:hypothetical protein